MSARKSTAAKPGKNKSLYQPLWGHRIGLVHRARRVRLRRKLPNQYVADTWAMVCMNMIIHTCDAETHRPISVSTYVEEKDNREVVDIAGLNAELASTVAKIDRLRADIDAIVAEIEGEEVGT